MRSLIFIILCMLLLCQTVFGVYTGNTETRRNFDDSSVSLRSAYTEDPDDISISSSDGSGVYNGPEYRELEGTIELSQILTNESSSPTDQTNSTLTSSNQSQPSTYSSTSVPSTSSIRKMETLTEIFNNESDSQSSTHYSSSESSAATNEGTKSSTKSITLLTTSSHEANESSSSADDDETEGVARGKPSTTESTITTTLQPKTLYQRTLALISDTYILSILVPVAGGVVFAATIIVTIATCRCLRRRCWRRRLRKKTLPDSVKNLRPSDRARLLAAESSDEEF